MFLKRILILALMVVPFIAGAQTSYVLPGMKEELMLDRMGIKFNPAYLKFSSIKPFNRRDAVADVEAIDTMQSKYLSAIDRYNMESFLVANSEWSTPGERFKSKKPVLKHLYKNQANAFELHNNDLSLVINPLIQFQFSKETENDDKVFLNSRGLHIRGMIERRIGFSFYFTENQEGAPIYVRNRVSKHVAVPGAGFYKDFKGYGYDYFDLRTSISWKVASFMDMQLAYDKNFIGNGHRSLFLSDFSNSYMFLKVNTHFKRFQYQNIFSELTGSHLLTGDRVYPRKYFRASYLNFAATNWLNLGLFDGVMMGRSDRLPIGLFNPVIFLNIPGDKKYLDNRSYIGFDIKANFLKRFQFYGQLLVDKLKTGGLKDKTWDNRFGYQAGLKYIDAFGLKNLDIQVETNRVRPYTYAADDSITNYTHYNQQLAHPLGANFEEYIVIVRAQPIKKLYLQGKLLGARQGLDLAGYNLGSDVFGGFDNRLSDTRVLVGDGDPATWGYVSFVASYELRQNLFIDASIVKREYKTELTPNDPKLNTVIVGIGIRLNMARREYDF